MSETIFQSNNFQSSLSSMGYDLQVEKKRINDGTEEVKNELIKIWNKQYAGAQIFPDALNKLNLEAIDILLSFKNTLLYDDIVEKLTLNSKQRLFLPKIVWEICLNKNWNQVEAIIIEKMGVHESIAQKIAVILTEKIISQVKEKNSNQSIAQNNFLQKVESQKTDKTNETVSLAPEEAYRQFPEIGEQSITSEPIKIKASKDLVKPSIKNWLADYTFKLGFNAHSSIERSNYIFQDENTKKLSFQDKQNLSYILKAYDEKSLLNIDKILKRVVFPKIQATSNFGVNAQAKQEKTVTEKNDQISFSFAQKLPYEKMQATKQTSQVISFPKKESQASPLVRNVVNLKELD